MLTPWIIGHIAFFFFLVWPVLYAILYFAAGWRQPPPAEFREYDHSIAQQSTFVVNGETYQSPEQMPPAVRRQYEQAISVLPDKDGDGIPDLLQGDLSGLSGMQSADSVADRLRQLDSLRNQGLITDQEYSQKRAEILQGL